MSVIPSDVGGDSPPSSSPDGEDPRLAFVARQSRGSSAFADHDGAGSDSTAAGISYRVIFRSSTLRVARVFGVTISMSLYACAAEPPVVKGPSVETITFYDSGGFDNQLSAAMQASTTNVSVAFLGNVSINTLPGRISVWLAKVQDNEGKVVVADNGASGGGGDQTRSIELAGVLPSLLQAAYGYIHDAHLYGPASNYDAIILVSHKSADVQNITFRRRQP